MLRLQMLTSLILVLCAHAQLPQQLRSEQEHVTNVRSQTAALREQGGDQKIPWRKDARRVGAWMRSFFQDKENARVMQNHHHPSLSLQSPASSRQLQDSSLAGPGAVQASPNSTHSSLHAFSLPDPPTASAAAVPEKRSHHSDNGDNSLKGRHAGGAGLQGSAEESPINVEHRSQRCPVTDVLVGEDELPWACRQRYTWRHLGEHVYPSWLYETVCEGRSCWYGHFNCTPITYTVFVLETCGIGGCRDQRVPAPLRSRWQWTNLNVTVGCQCLR